MRRDRHDGDRASPPAGREDEDGIGRDAGEDLVIHYTPDGEPWLWEIEHASRHPERITNALAELQRHSAVELGTKVAPKAFGY